MSELRLTHILPSQLGRHTETGFRFKVSSGRPKKQGIDLAISLDW